MKRLTLKWLTCAALTSALWLPATSQAGDPLPVVASFSILGDLVKVVGAERVKVTTLVGLNADAHTFEPSPADAKTILDARLLVLNGLHFEPWAQKLAKSASYKGATLIASTGVQPRSLPEHAGHHHGHDDVDPHAWLDPRNVMVYVHNIAQSLSSLDPEGAASYQANSAAYLKELEALDAFIQAELAPVPVAQRRVITSHDAFGYFGARYRVRFSALQGANPQGEPSAKDVAQLIRQIRKEKIRAVFVENMRNPQMLAQLSKDTGVSLGAKLYVGALSGPGEPGNTYLKMMRHNVTQLANGMKLN